MNIAEQIGIEMDRLLPGSRTARIVTTSGRYPRQPAAPADEWTDFSIRIEEEDGRHRIVVDVPMYDDAVTVVTLDKTPGDDRLLLDARDALRALVPRIVNGWYRNALQHVRTANEALLSFLAPADIVRNVVKYALAVLPEGDAGVFRIHDEESDILIAVAQIGFSDDYLSHRYQRNESISGIVFETQRPILLRTHSEVRNARRNLSPENMAFLQKSRIARSLICVPVRIGDKRLGTLTLLNFREEAAFSRFGLSTLEIFASHLAIAWKNARAHDVALRNLELQQELRKALAAKNRELSSALSIHTDILSAFASADDLEEKLRATAGKLGLRLGYRDIFGNRFSSEGAPAESPAAEASVHSFPIQISNVEVGLLTLDQGHDDAVDRIRAEILTSFIALEIRKDVTSQDLLNRKKSRLFEDFASNPGAILVSELARHKFSFKRHSQIHVVKYPDTVPPEEASIFFQRALSRIGRELKFSNGFLFYEADRVVVLLSSDRLDALQAAAGRLGAAIPSEKAYCGTSAVFEAATPLRIHYRNALESAQILEMKGSFGIQHYDRIGIEKLLVNQDKDRVVHFVESVIGPITGHNRQPLYKTLLAYINNGKSISETAREIGIHTNTVYQRLEKIQELTGYRISNANDFITLSVACHLKQAFK